MRPADLPAWAEQQAEALLSGLGDRWKHVRSVGQRAIHISPVVEEQDRPYLIAAAFLHDIGYAPQLQRTGLHQLDGARWVRSFDWRLACLVAHHSASRFEITLRGFGAELAQYQREETSTSDALIYCDLTTGPTGLRMSLEERVREVEARYGEGQIVEALRQARPHLAAAIARTKQRLRAQAITA